MDELSQKIKSALQISRPYLQKDGGDVEYIDFENTTGVLKIKFLGTCAICPISRMTLRAAVERIVMSKVSAVKRIEQII